LVDTGCDLVGDGFELVGSVAHGDAVANGGEEVDIVVAVTYADGVLAVNVELLEHLQQRWLG